MDQGTKRIFLVDIDGTICENIPNEDGVERMRNAKPYEESVRAVNRLYDHGNFICFFTARTDEHAEVTKEWLQEHKVKYHQIIFNKPRKSSTFTEYHFIDDTHAKATTFKGKFTHFIKKKIEIEVFED